MINESLYTSNKQDWETPQWLFDKLNSHLNFTLDVCADFSNAKCKEYYNIADNGLSQEWKGMCYCNPPYNDIATWVKKSYEESQKDCTVVMLIPARTDTKIWHQYISKGSVTLLKGRLKFSNSKNSAPFPSCIVVFGKQYDASIRNQADDFLFEEMNK